MKFDVARAMAWVQAFDFPRFSECEGERRAAELLAERFEQCGWRVERSQTRTGCRTSSFLLIVCLVFTCLLTYLWKAWYRTLPGAGFGIRAVVWAGSLLAVTAAARLVIGRTGVHALCERLAPYRTSGERRARVNVVASRAPGDDEPPTRVLFVSHLDAPTPAGGWEDWFWMLLLLGFVLVVRSRIPPIWAAWAGAGLWFGFILCAARFWLRPGLPSPGDNRSGLAILAELAQVLPPKMFESVEIRLAAVGGHALGQLGALTLADSVRRRWTAKPTLVINLDAPGLGADVVLVGHGRALEITRSAAADLWVPHRVARWPLRALDHRPFVLCGFSGVSLAGDRRGRRIDPSRLTATAQLAAEVALRWARRQAESAQGDSLAKSSQKPG